MTRSAAIMTALNVVLAALLASGCASTVDGAAVPVDRGYRANITTEVARERLSEHDRMRRVDPCGFIDEASATSIGRVAYFGPGLDQDGCEVRFDRLTTPKRIWALRMTITVIQDGSGQATSFAGRSASETSLDGMCSIALDYQGERAFHYTLDSEDGSPCEELRAIVTASAPLLDINPPRAESAKMPKTKAWTLDPCAALSTTFPAEQRFYMTGLPSNPFECDFWLGNRAEPGDVNRHKITYSHIHQSQVTFMAPADRRLRIVGVDAREHRGEKDYCKITAFVGANNPFPTTDYYGKPEPLVEAVEVTGTGCDNVRRLAAEVVKNYQKG